MRWRAWIALGLVAACLAVFGQVRDHEFVGFDDYDTELARYKDS